MKFRFHASNWNLAALLALLAAAAGCASTPKDKDKDEDKEIATIRLHFEVNPQVVRRNMEVSVLRAQPMKLFVAEEPLVHEGYLDRAEVVEEDGIPRIRLKFDDAGRRLLETETAVNRGKRIAVGAQFPDIRWLAAPVITRINTNGVFAFTPDADMEECQRLVKGLNLAVEQRLKNSWFK